jgi:hypothetical protein
MPISRQIIKPSDCLLAIAMPLSKKSIRRNLKASIDAEFSKKICWQLYKEDTLLPYKYLYRLAKKLNVGIKSEFSFADLKHFFDTDRYRVIILVAHWSGSAIELFDKFCTPEQFLDICPEHKKFIIDLNICHCTKFANEVAPMRTEALFKRDVQDRPSYPGAWFLFYKGFLKFISDHDLTYLAALKQNSIYYKQIF